MAMQMIVAGGIALVTDNLRVPDADNPRGYYEFERVKNLRADKAWLAENLGQGEVQMTLSLDGASEVRETAFHGVWWLIHHNGRGVLTGEFIEINSVPALVSAHPDDIRQAADRLGFLINEL